jgi:tetratricopeptide (TPR) repeat protein
VDFPLQIPVILFLAATMAGSLWGMMAPEGGGSRVGRPVNLVLIVALLAIVGLQSAKRDGITAGNLGLLADDSAGLAQIESQLSRERAGAREGIGRLAFVWSVTVAKEKGPSAGLDASVVAAAAARRRTVAQPLDAAAHLAEASSWALATELMRKHNLVGLLQPEEMLASAEQAVSRAFSLEPTNPLVLLEIARIQLQLGRWSPLKKGHYRRAALALTKAIALDPWASSKAYRLSDELGESDFLLLTTSQPQACFENGLAWQRRGDIQRAESQFREALSIDGDFAAAHFSLGTILRARNDPAFDHHFRQFLALGNRHSGMGAWSMLWLGETERAITLFRDLLEDEPDRTWLKSGLEQANLQAKGNLTF